MKSRTIELGIGPDGPVHLDLDIFLRTRGYVSASSGGGKSHLLRRMIEQISPLVQCLVLDWEGEFSTLRKKFPFVLVGEGGETPARPHTAAQVALTLLKLGTSAVCDLYELKGNGRHEFVRNFVNAMVTAPKELWHPVVVFIDEAHYLCPENGYGESVAKDAIIDLCNLGRKRGFCPVLATQRASKVSKNAVEPLQNFLIGLTMPDDHKRVTDTFKVAAGAPKREFEKELMSLEQGQFFVRGAAIGKEQQLIMVGGTQTQPPPTGSAAAAKRTPTPDAIKKLLPQLEDIPVEVERKAKTESELRAEIAELKKYKIVSPSITPERERMLLETINALETNLATTKRTAGAYEKAMDGIFMQAGKMQDAATEIRGIVVNVRQTIADTPQPVPVKVAGKNLTRRDFAMPKMDESTYYQPKPEAIEGLSTAHMKILRALAELAAVGVHAPARLQVSLFAGYSNPKSGGFAGPVGNLVESGHIRSSNGVLSIAEQGMKAVGGGIAAATTEDLHRRLQTLLGGAEWRILSELIERYPKDVDRAKLAEIAGYSNHKSGGFAGPMGRLVSLGLAETTSAGQVAGTSLLFI